MLTADGSLSIDGRHIDITSSDYDFLREIKKLIGIDNKIGVKYGSKRKRGFGIQITNRNFYDFLFSIGLWPNKSATLGPINVPNKYFIDFLRGLIDGDGSIRRWIQPTNKREQWSLRVYSGSRIFFHWLQEKISARLRVKGKFYQEQRSPASLFTLKYGKMAAREIMKKCYCRNVFALRRKAKLAQECCSSYRGWKQSKTVFN